MNSYAIVFASRVEKALAVLPQEIQLRILEKVQELAQNPFPVGAKKLKDRSGYRVRVGDYRIIYDIEDNVLLVTIVAVGHRKEIYE